MPSDNAVSKPNKAYEAMSARWRLPRLLMGGTWRLREEARLNINRLNENRPTSQNVNRALFRDVLPKDKLETDDRYISRIARSKLFNYFAKTIDHLVGKPFSRPITFREDMPSRAVDWAEDIDLSGRNLNTFARDVFADAWVTGKSHILVDFPTVDGAGEQTRADEQNQGVRPYFVHVPSENLIGWRHERREGRDFLTQIRIHETVTEHDGDFGEREVERVRVIRPNEWQLWEKVQTDEKTSWQMVDDGELSLGFIPLATVYTNRMNFMEALPPLEDLAFTNLVHWQSESDQRNILHVARVPILAAFGISESEDGSVIQIGTDGVFTGPMDADLKWVELQGKSIESGEKDLERLTEEMVQLGMEPLMPRSGSVTATATALAESKSNSRLKAAVEGLRDALETSFLYAGKWTGEEIDGSLDIFTDFELGIRDSATIEALLKARATGEISRATFLEQLRRYEVLPEDFDIEMELERVAAETLTPGTTGRQRDSLRDALRSAGVDDGTISAALDRMQDEVD